MDWMKPDTNEHNVAKLKELKELLDAGALTQEEFNNEKAKVLGPATVGAVPMAQPEIAPETVTPVMPPPPMQPAMIQPAPWVQAWVGTPPPKPNAPSWFGMYKPDDCEAGCHTLCCPACAYGEVMEWATDQPGSQGSHCMTYFFCSMLPCALFAIPSMQSDARKASERKIWNFHRTRGGAHRAASGLYELIASHPAQNHS